MPSQDGTSLTAEIMLSLQEKITTPSQQGDRKQKRLSTHCKAEENTHSLQSRREYALTADRISRQG
jgi:hypothetical protein